MSPAPRQVELLGRLAAIDVGTNSIRLVVVEVGADRQYRILDDEKVVARLGRGVAAKDELDRELMEEAATTVARFKTIADGYNVEEVCAAATWAVREASNGKVFSELVKQRSGLTLQVLSAEQEARFAFGGVRQAFDLDSMPVAVMDVGGGSTEIVLATGKLIDEIYELPLGSVGLTERFGMADMPGTERYREMRRFIRRALSRHIGRIPFRPNLLFGTGGTFNTLAAISTHRGSRARVDAMLPFTVRGYELKRSEVKHILNLLRKVPLRDRIRVPGLSPDRADIIVAGVAIVECALKHFDINLVRVADQGIRAGLVHTMIEKLWPRPTSGEAPLDRMQSVRQFAATCGYERRHAEHVALLAGQIFDQLVEDRIGPWAVAENRELLIAAALLHDVGYLVNYSKHHKHSYHLIIHSGLPGFTQREMSLIANIARYHRGAAPKHKHVNFAHHTPEDQLLIRRLAGILRLAVGLDRSHTQEIRRVRLRCADKTAFIDVEANGNPSVNLWAGERTCGLFEEACGRRVRFAWSAAGREEEEVEHARTQ